MGWTRHTNARRGRPVPPPEPENGIVTAISNGDRGWLESLLAAGADANKPHRGTLPLTFAARRGEFDIVDKLLAHGARIDGRDDAGATALMDAVRRDDVDAAHALLARGADVGVAAKNGQTPLHEACAQNDAAMLRVLVLAGASADAADAEGRRPRDICLHGGKYLQSALEDAEKDRAARVQAAAATLQNNITLPRAPVIRPRRLQGPARR